MNSIIIKTLKLFLLLCFFTSFNSNINAAKPLWQGKGRIAMSSDGNNHDNDDWSATPMSLALIASQHLQDKFCLYTYSDHIWGNATWRDAYGQMKISALGTGKVFGFDTSKFICAVDDPEKAYNAMRDQINKSSKNNPLFIIAAGPMQVIGEALHRSKKSKRKFITVVSHSWWNNEHSDAPKGKETPHIGWTWNDMISEFGTKKGGNTKFIYINDQNGGADYAGLSTCASEWDWVKTSPARNNIKLYKPGSWDFLYERLQNNNHVPKSKPEEGHIIDASDAGMLVYFFTGNERTDVFMAKDLMEGHMPKPRGKKSLISGVKLNRPADKAYKLGSTILLSSDYNAGVNQYVSGNDNYLGVKYILRECNAGGKKVKDLLCVKDKSAIGNQLGHSQASMDLINIPISNSLPSKHYYELAAEIMTSNKARYVSVDNFKIQIK